MTISTPSNSGWIWPSRNKPAFPWISISFPGQLSKKGTEGQKHRTLLQREAVFCVGASHLKPGLKQKCVKLVPNEVVYYVLETSIIGEGPSLCPPLQGLTQLLGTSAGRPDEGSVFPTPLPWFSRAHRWGEEPLQQMRSCAARPQGTWHRRPPHTGCPLESHTLQHSFLPNTNHINSQDLMNHNARKNSWQPSDKHSPSSHF